MRGLESTRDTDFTHEIEILVPPSILHTFPCDLTKVSFGLDEAAALLADHGSVGRYKSRDGSSNTVRSVSLPGGLVRA
jgi:hypothetical protein